MYGIAKSILFLVGEEPVMVVTCGDVKVSQSWLKQHLGAKGKAKMADAEATAAITGFPPGGVCPFALQQPVGVDAENYPRYREALKIIASLLLYRLLRKADKA
ncbi:hypothetical protein MHLNE_06710 [Moorella humiferrea]